VVLPDGTLVLHGSRVVGTGVIAPYDVLPDWSIPDSLLGSLGRFCATGDDHVLLLDDVLEVVPPSR
jgi:hypothetical protein